MSRIVQIDFEGVESGGGKIHVPEGDYKFEIVKITTKKSSSGFPTLFFGLKLNSGPKNGNGKTLRHSCSLQKQALWNLRNLLEACGKEVPSKPVKIDLDKLIGLEGAVSVVDGEYEGKTTSEVATFYPLSDFGNTGDDIEEEPEEEEEAPKKPGKKKPVEEEETEEEEEKPKKPKKKDEEETSDEEDLFS
jgi:hypothetical protein